MDRFSPVAPAHIRVLVLPVGEVERTRYLAFLDRLKNEASIIPLSGVEAHIRDNEELPSPKGFKHGCLLFNYMAIPPSEQQQQLSPFELFREPLLVLGIKDSLNSKNEVDESEAAAALEYLRERHPRVVHRQLLVLEEADNEPADRMIRIRNAGRINDPSLMHAICRASARFLVELAVYIRALKASPSILTPGYTARSLQRTTSLKESGKRPASSHNTPPQSVAASSPVDEQARPLPPLPLDRSSPATSFDYMPGANGASSRPSRPISRSSFQSRPGARASSQDRVLVQGFGSSTTQENLKARGKARIGIVLGFIFIMAGQWSEGMRILVEHTNKARILSDHLWHAKGLEGAVVCMVMHIWAGLEFQIPSILNPIGDRATPGHTQRFSVNLPSESKLGDITQEASIRRFSSSLVDLVKLSLSLYRSGEGSLELPFICISEVTIRLCKLLAILHNAGGELNRGTLQESMGKSARDDVIARTAPPSATVGLSKTAIADMLSHAQPTGQDGVLVSDHVAILAGTISVYGLLGMGRKKAIVTRDLIVKLTDALIQARRRGAAEMGIHPAASLSTETGADTMLSSTDGSSGLYQMISELGAIYGISLLEPSTGGSTERPSSFGSNSLKLSVAKELAAFCEALPDPLGVLRLSSAMLKWLGPNAAIVSETDAMTSRLSKEDQLRFTTIISRTIGVSTQLGTTKIEATYWDAFLVRSVAFISPESSQAMLDRTKMKSRTDIVEEGRPGNPLLYDPNASRPGAAAEVQKTYLLVQNEVSVCVVTLQNPYEVSVDIESLQLITEGVELTTSHRPVVLSTMRLQQVSLSVSPCSTGDCKITGCRVKISGCAEQNFSIISKPWSPPLPTLIKYVGQDERRSLELSKDDDQGNAPEHATVAINVIDPQPTLVLESTSLLESSLMLLDGETQELTIKLRNTSRTAASVFDIVASNDVLQLQKPADHTSACSLKDPVIVQPGSSACFPFQLTGRPGVSQTQVALYYGCNLDVTKYARMLQIPINITVNDALKVQHMVAMPLNGYADDDSSFILSFDIGNAWPKALSYSCSMPEEADRNETELRSSAQASVLAPGEIRRIYLPVKRLQDLIDTSNDAEKIRKSLLDRLAVNWTWQERAGKADVSSLTLGDDALEVVLGARIHIELELVHVNRSTDDLGPEAKPSVKAGAFVHLRAKLLNRTARASPLLVEMDSPPLNSTTFTQDYGRVAVIGAHRRVIPPITEGGERSVDFVICPLLPGMIELEVVARPAELKNATAPLWKASRCLRLLVV